MHHRYNIVVVVLPLVAVGTQGLVLQVVELQYVCVSAGTCTCIYMYMRCGFKSHLRQLIFLRKSDCLGHAVLLCLVVCLTLSLLASFFPPSHLSLKHVLVYIYTCI